MITIDLVQPNDRIGLSLIGNAVTKVHLNTPAKKAGICKGWIILKINSKIPDDNRKN